MKPASNAQLVYNVQWVAILSEQTPLVNSSAQNIAFILDILNFLILFPYYLIHHQHIKATCLLSYTLPRWFSCYTMFWSNYFRL